LCCKRKPTDQLSFGKLRGSRRSRPQRQRRRCRICEIFADETDGLAGRRINRFSLFLFLLPRSTVAGAAQKSNSAQDRIVILILAVFYNVRHRLERIVAHIDHQLRDVVLVEDRSLQKHVQYRDGRESQPVPR